jgi:hypothetical protein
LPTRNWVTLLTSACTRSPPGAPAGAGTVKGELVAETISGTRPPVKRMVARASDEALT